MPFRNTLHWGKASTLFDTVPTEERRKARALHGEHGRRPASSVQTFARARTQNEFKSGAGTVPESRGWRGVLPRRTAHSTAPSLERTLGANDRGHHAAQELQKFILLELT